MNAPAPEAPVAAPRSVFRRLLGYAYPHRGTFMIGVRGMTLFAATDGTLALFVKQFVDGTFFEKNARVLWLIPLGAPVLFLLRGIGDYMSVYFPGLVGRRVIKAIRGDLFLHYLTLPTRYYDRETGQSHVAAHLQRRAGGRGGDKSMPGDSRHAHHRGVDRYPDSSELAAGVVCIGAGTAAVLADPQCQPFAATAAASSLHRAISHAPSKLRWASGHQGVQRAGCRGA
jgi:ABC-type multidrug transport system fused ATPase/permease subunit